MSSSTKEKKQPQPLVRIDAADKIVLDQLAAKTGESSPRVLHRAIMQFKKQLFFAQVNGAYAAMKQDPEAWEAELSERAVLDNTASDGL